jgi:hypothetical protein
MPADERVRILKPHLLEHKTRPVLTRRQFAWRMARFGGAAVFVVVVSLFAGAMGYHVLEGLSWLDAVYSAAMILTGMGPVHELTHDSAKVFVTIYALFSGVVFLSAATLLVTPIAHRVFHILHVEAKGRGDN